MSHTFLTHFNTILFDENTGLPVTDENESTSVTIHETNRILHHILINMINRILVKLGCREIEYAPRRRTHEGNLASVKLKAYPVVDPDGTVRLCEINEIDQEYTLLKAALMNIFDEYLNKDNGKTTTLVLGDDVEEIVKKESITDYIQITRQQLLQQAKEEIQHLIQTNQYNLMQMTMNAGQSVNTSVFSMNTVQQQSQQYLHQQKSMESNVNVTQPLGTIIPMNLTSNTNFNYVSIQIPQIPNTMIRVSVQVSNENGDLVYDNSIQSHSSVFFQSNHQEINQNQSMMNTETISVYQPQENNTNKNIFDLENDDEDDENDSNEELD